MLKLGEALALAEVVKMLAFREVGRFGPGREADKDAPFGGKQEEQGYNPQAQSMGKLMEDRHQARSMRR
jgi:hypothetical protein